jgi:hypothetical protein
MSEKLNTTSMKAAARQERAELAHEVKDFVNVDSRDRGHVPAGNGKTSGSFLSDHELKMINAHKGQIENGLEARNADYIINRLISHNGENELTDPAEIRDALVVGLDDLDLDDYSDEEIMQFVEDKRHELAEYNGSSIAKKEAFREATVDAQNPEIAQLKAENAELRSELAEMRKAIAELTAALRGEVPAQGFNTDTEVDAAKARLSAEAQAKAQAAIDEIHSTDQAKADKALLDDSMGDLKIAPEQQALDAAEKKSEKRSESELDQSYTVGLWRKLMEKDGASSDEGDRSSQVTGDTFHAPAGGESSLVERMRVIQGAESGDQAASQPSGSDGSLAARMNAIASASANSDVSAESNRSSRRGIRGRDWLRNPLASAGGVLNARAEARTRAERDNGSDKSRRRRLLAGFVLFGGAVGGGLLLMKGHDIFGHSNGGSHNWIGDIKDQIPTDPTDPTIRDPDDGKVTEALKTVRVNPGDGEIKVVQHILDQQGIHVDTIEAQRIGELANVDLLVGDNNYDDAQSTLDRIGAKPGAYKIRPGSAEALVEAAHELGIK